MKAPLKADWARGMATKLDPILHYSMNVIVMTSVVMIMTLMGCMSPILILTLSCHTNIASRMGMVNGM